ncbi:Retrovirus-related Pol polyprotein from transposon opus [Labeo rohita]|uniref:Gypsy retrotransposon integrase-like protein 1 n=1 Tax=Labeo rohita TaxID=84645 RepID=A0ABQ8L4Y5_LABRO|nr:Retrovirus-related Pol polyprotein from transposon opus [Labeo rohita]
MPSSAHESLYCAHTVQEPDFCSEPSTSPHGPPHIEPKVLPSSAEKTFQLSPDQLSTPEVQRVVVEHIVKNTEMATHFQSTVRLKPFSGRVPCPNYEVDYDTWRSSLEFYMTDSSLSDVMMVRRIVDSLLPPAADVVKPLGPRATSKAYLDLLDSAYATVEDGDELFVKFLNTNQNHGEKPSSYLQRQIALNIILKKKAISDSDANKQLLKQFCRGCWNNNIISTLQLEQKKHHPPTFTEFLLLLRTEEDRIAAKDSRMKQHLGLAKAKALSNTQVTFPLESDGFAASKLVDSSSSAVKQIQKQIADLQAQLAALTTSKREVSGKVKATKEKKSKLSENHTPKKQEATNTSRHLFRQKEKSCRGNKRPGRRKKMCGQTKSLPSFKLIRVPVEELTGTEPQTGSQNRPRFKVALNEHQAHHIVLPKGLIGSKVTANVKLEGVDCNCLLYSVNRYQLISQTFYNQHLSEHPIRSVSEVLEVEGANGQKVPYTGYVQVSVQFPKGFINSEPQMHTLALIVPDTRSNSSIPVIIGTNTLDSLYEQHCDMNSSGSTPFYGYAQILKTLQLRHQQSSSETIPFKTPVQVRNETDHDITIPINCVIAELSVPHDIIWNIHPDQAEPAAYCSSQQNVDTRPNLKFDFGNSPLSEEWKKHITAKLNSYSDVFAQHDLDYGHATKVKHRIKLSDETPFKQRSLPIHPQDYEAVKKHLQSLLDAGIIRESESPFSSPIVVVCKRNGDVRLCVGYRRLNLRTIKDAYALPNLEVSFCALSGSRWFSVMDLKSGFYQIEMEESDKQKTAFVCPLGFLESNRMPQGITNAPSTFQRLMEKCMGDINLREVLVFFNDLIVFSKTLEEHEAILCQIKVWRQIQRKFVQDYSKIVKPLTNLTSGYPPVRKGCVMAKAGSKYLNPKDPFAERWTPACQEAFETIIHKLTSSPILGFADLQLPYTLHTDASTTGLGAVLYQKQNRQDRVIAYASRGLSQSESRYPAHKLEFLALKWAVTEKFHDYLYGNVFTVLTDNNPLRYVLTTAKLDAASYRWLAALSTFTFNITYRAGRQNHDADGLSRRPHGECENNKPSEEKSSRILQFISSHFTSDLYPVEAVKATCQKHIMANEEGDVPPCLIESLAIHSNAIPEAFNEGELSYGLTTVPKYSNAELADLQRKDPIISRILNMIQLGEPAPPNLKAEPAEFCLLLREMNRLEMVDGLLYRRRQCDHRSVYQFVLPSVLRSSDLDSLHNEMGHFGFEPTLEPVRARFYWPKMSSDVETKIRTCGRCVRRKVSQRKQHPW